MKQLSVEWKMMSDLERRPYTEKWKLAHEQAKRSSANASSHKDATSQPQEQPRRAVGRLLKKYKLHHSERSEHHLSLLLQDFNTTVKKRKTMKWLLKQLDIIAAKDGLSC